MRRLWTNEIKINWDDFILEKYRREWDIFFNDLLDMKEIIIKRCIKLSNLFEDFVFIIFSDGSNDVYGVCVYVRWKLSIGGFDSYFILLKNRFVLVKRILIDRIELCGVLFNKRIKIIL